MLNIRITLDASTSNPVPCRLPSDSITTQAVDIGALGARGSIFLAPKVHEQSVGPCGDGVVLTAVRRGIDVAGSALDIERAGRSENAGDENRKEGERQLG